LAVILAIWSKQVYISLLAGIYLGWVIINNWNPLKGFSSTFEGLIDVFKDGGNAKVIIFCGLVGALITLMQYSGGMNGFINFVSDKGWIKNRRAAQLIAGMIGIIIFVETSISSLIVGSISRPIFDQKKISREKLAYICDSTSAPVNLLIPLNAWGAFIIGLLHQEKIVDPIKVMVSVLPFNFYAFTALAIVFYLIWSGKDFGPMKRAEDRVKVEQGNLTTSTQIQKSDEIMTIKPKPGIKYRASNMLFPVITMVIMMPLGLFITGNGDLTKGSGSTSVYWAVVVSIIITSILYLTRRILTIKEITNLIIKGIGGMVPVMILMLFAFAIGDVTGQLNTGLYVASLAKMFLNPVFIPIILFLISGFIAFSTGTSWGTYAIIVPIAVAISSTSGVNLPLILAAVLGGGLFGDHSSPISDTTIIASMAALCNHIDHVRTQLPYALTAAIASLVLYFITGLFIN
jgi:Na+/H+ antiporter NhaC